MVVGVGQEPVTWYNGHLGAYRTRGMGIGYPLLERNGQLIIFIQKETIFISFTLITFAVYEREQNWPPQTVPHQILSEIWAIAYSVQNNRGRKKDFARLV